MGERICPQCHSREIEEFSEGLIFTKTYWVCSNCGWKWGDE